MANNAPSSNSRPVLLMTRPEVAARSFLKRMGSDTLQDVEICLSPLLKILPLHPEFHLGACRGVIFTSKIGVSLAKPQEHLPCYCVGERTAQAAKERGWQVQRTAEDADTLVDTLIGLRPDAPLIHLSGTHRRGKISQRLTAAGLQTEVVELYDQSLLPLTSEAQAILSGEAPVILPLFSARTADQFRTQAENVRNLHVLAISQPVADVVDGLPLMSVHVAQAPTGAEMVKGLKMILRENSLP